MSRPFEGFLGVFDSGVGGLTVVEAVLRRFPNERVLYVADQAHVPYGGRPLDEVRGFATGISTFLAEQGCRAIVMACNISSAVALPSVEKELAPIPVLGMIGPAALRAAAVDSELQPDAESPIIGVLATEGTVQSGAYPKAIMACNPSATVAQVPCPRFVPLVESGETETAEALDAAREYLTFPARLRCRTIVLGCTHYPYLMPALQRAACDLFDAPVTFVDPAFEVAAALPPRPEGEPFSRPSLLLTTGSADNFRQQAPRFLPNAEFDTAAAVWKDERLVICDGDS